MKPYVVLEKAVGQTPLECMELWRTAQPSEYKNTPLTYAGRLDPMASGKLLILIGEECKNQDAYRNLDKEYEFEVLFGVTSDTGDVLGIVTPEIKHRHIITQESLQTICESLTGNIELPYPHYSSKTVHGKPLHTWALENRLAEIEIPTKTSNIHTLSCINVQTISKEAIYEQVRQKIETVTPVTEASKSIGNDFRRPDVRASWRSFMETETANTFYIGTFSCTASSGTYMRTLAEVIAQNMNTVGLAYSIHRTHIGIYKKLPIIGGIWTKRWQ